LGACADAAIVLGKFVGYSIVASKTVEAFIDKGKQKQDGFEGCEYDRIIVFTDGTGVVCRTYSYTYSYRPDAVLLAKQLSYQGKQFMSLKLIVGNDAYDVDTP
jgi:hypothetical protein